MPAPENAVNVIPVVGTVKGIVQCFQGNSSDGVQAIKDSVKIPGAIAAVAVMCIGGGHMDVEGDRSWEEQQDAHAATSSWVSDIWKW